QEEANVAATTQFVQADQSRTDIRRLAARLRLERGNLLIECREIVGNRARVTLRLSQLLGLDLSVDLELAQIAEEALLLLREAIRLVVQCAKPLGGAPGESVSLGSIGLLSAHAAARQHDQRDRTAVKALHHGLNIVSAVHAANIGPPWQPFN